MESTKTTRAGDAIERPAVLFLCTGNSARSQMAEALFRHRAGDKFEAHSAGLDPKGVNPLTVRVMNEIGINIDDQSSKSLSDYLGKIPVRFAITVCTNAEDQCPRIWPFGATVLHWPFDDPAAAEGSEEVRLETFRRVRNEIDDKIKSWLEEPR